MISDVSDYANQTHSGDDFTVRIVRQMMCTRFADNRGPRGSTFYTGPSGSFIEELFVSAINEIEGSSLVGTLDDGSEFDFR